MTQIPELLNALNEVGHIDDDIWCEDDEEVIKEYNQIIWKYEKKFTKAVKVNEMLVERNYIQDDFEGAFGFIFGYFYFLKDN